MKFSNGQEMYECITSGTDLWDGESTYVFVYNDYDSICVYNNIYPDEARELERLTGGEEYWGAYLGWHGSAIYDSKAYYEQKKDYNADALSDVIDEAVGWCNDHYEGDWIDVSPKEI